MIPGTAVKKFTLAPFGPDGPGRPISPCGEIKSFIHIFLAYRLKAVQVECVAVVRTVSPVKPLLPGGPGGPGVPYNKAKRNRFC